MTRWPTGSASLRVAPQGLLLCGWSVWLRFPQCNRCFLRDLRKPFENARIALLNKEDEKFSLLCWCEKTASLFERHIRMKFPERGPDDGTQLRAAQSDPVLGLGQITLDDFFSASDGVVIKDEFVNGFYTVLTRSPTLRSG